MGNGYQRFPRTDGVQGLGHLSLGHAVEVGGCFIKNHDGGTLQQDSGDGDSLALSSAQFHAVLAAPFVELCGEVAEPGGGECFFDIVVGGFRPGKGQVFADGFGEEVGALRDEGYLAAQLFGVEKGDVVASDGDAPFTAVPEAHEE